MTTVRMDPGLPAGDDTLREHLGYSLDLIAMSSREIAEPIHSDSDREWFREMSIIEVFWTQARILTEFFTGALASSTTAAAIVRAVKNFEKNLRPGAEEVWNARVTGRKTIEPGLIYVFPILSACT